MPIEQKLQIRKAVRSQAKLKVGVQGPSGSGKTLGALELAFALAPTGRVLVADSENGSASLYADRYDFDTVDIFPPYTSAKYRQVIDAAVSNGYEALVIDSVSHQWAGDGGILSRKEQVDARGGNHFSNWAAFTKEHNEFRAAFLNAPVHIVATLQSKQAYVLEEGSDKKSKPKKVGLAPVQREGMEYDFTVVFEVDKDHNASSSKDRTGLFPASDYFDLVSGKVGQRLAEWLNSGAPSAQVSWTSEELGRFAAGMEQLEALCLAARFAPEKVEEKLSRLRERAYVRREAAAAVLTDLDAALGAMQKKTEAAPSPTPETATASLWTEEHTKAAATMLSELGKVCALSAESVEWWKERVQGYEAMVGVGDPQKTLEGFRKMLDSVQKKARQQAAPKGGAPVLTPDEVRAAVDSAPTMTLAQLAQGIAANWKLVKEAWRAAGHDPDRGNCAELCEGWGKQVERAGMSEEEASLALKEAYYVGQARYLGEGCPWRWA